MDISARLQLRAKPSPYLDRERTGMPDDSSGESEGNFVRRKFQRTATDPDTTTSSSDASIFRKPTLPASAARGDDRRTSITHQRRRSTLRENARVPSGPREFPSPPRRNFSSGSNAPSMLDATNTSSRSFLPQSSSESLLSNPRLLSSSSKPASAGTDGIAPRPLERSTSDFDFLPDINFDDFQTSLQNYDSTSVASREFSGMGDDRRLLSRDADGRVMLRNNGPGSPAKSRVDSLHRSEMSLQDNAGVQRTSSLRQRLGTGRQTSGDHGVAVREAQHAHQGSTSSVRDRRKSAMPPSAAAPPTSLATAARPPRKSVGPGLLSTTRKPSGDTAPADVPPELSAKALASRTDSLRARRTTLQPSSSSAADLPRVSTLTATTQARANKVKSLQPPPRESQDPGTSGTQKTPRATATNTARAHTPSSSGNRRPSDTRSGRASGLGARTISPTDARRLKRQTMAAPPPMPSYPNRPAPTVQDDTASTLQTSLMPELPRLAQPSPSLIPRKTNAATPSSASPDARQGYPSNAGGGVTLNSKSSFSSLTNVPSSGSTSRLPTPRGRQAMPSGAALPQYSDQYTDGDSEEIVPPVPAIPKAYESPKDLDVEHPPFFSTALKSSYPASADSSAFEASLDFASIPAPFASSSNVGRSSFDAGSLESPHKRTGDHVARASHRRNLTGGGGSSGNAMPPPSSIPPRSSKGQPDTNGRQNANRQPLRLPPLNMAPIRTHTGRQPSNASLPRPTDEVENRDEVPPQSNQTPEPRRAPKTPSTPMTASKATSFFRRQEEKEKIMRSSSSHFALRDVLSGNDTVPLMTSKFWDDPDANVESGLPMPMPESQNKSRNAITPFSSGSLPKGSGEFSRLRERPSGEYDDEYSRNGIQGAAQRQQNSGRPHGPRARAQTGGTISSINSNTPQTPGSLDSPGTENGVRKDGADKKDKEPGSASGLRRKLSLGWRRSSSKNANHAENKNSPRQQQPDVLPNDKERESSSKLQKRRNDMPPPQLPASATWSGELPSLPSASARQSFDVAGTGHGHFRRKSNVPPPTATGIAPSMEPLQYNGLNTTDNSKPTRLHSEAPQPVKIAPNNTRSSSWGNLLATNGPLRPLTNGKPSTNGKASASSGESAAISVLVKDKDDLVADDEMHRLSRKRKDVDSAARETEDLKKRAKAVPPMSAEQVLHDRSLTGGAGLNIFERGEIVDYDKDGIYFTGSRSARKVVGSLTANGVQTATPSSSDVKDGSGGSNNFGYDDERGDYNIVFGDHLSYRYEVVDILGKGSFGQVVRCVDHKEGGIVAVKIIRNKKRFHQQALVEVGILGKLREWDPDGSRATLSVTGSFYFRNHLCIVTPCLSINLYELIRAHNFAGFQLPLIRRFARQLLACLTLLQTKKIIHCDLKPENILLCDARKADVRVIDFGSSCREEEKVYTYIQSRFYRSPEVILGSSYGLGIDMWSLGCILAELWTGYPLFPGENEQEQLACIMEIFGPPDRHLVEGCTRKKLFFDSVGKPRVTVSSKGRRRRPSSKTLSQALKTDDDAFVDFIARCLRWDPDRRLKPAEAISHPFVTNQPFHPPAAGRAGLADDARRGAVRSTRPITSAGASASASAATSSTAATAAVANSKVPSPVKRSANAFAQQSATITGSTPARVAKISNDLPGLPSSQTANSRPVLPPSAASTTALPAPPVSSSPLKSGHAMHSNVNIAAGGGREPSRRHSTLATAGAAAMAGNKRASNGAFLSTTTNGSSNSNLNSIHNHHGRPSLSSAASLSSSSLSTPVGGAIAPPPPPPLVHQRSHNSSNGGIAMAAARESLGGVSSGTGSGGVNVAAAAAAAATMKPQGQRR